MAFFTGKIDGKQSGNNIFNIILFAFSNYSYSVDVADKQLKSVMIGVSQLENGFFVEKDEFLCL